MDWNTGKMGNEREVRIESNKLENTEERNRK
jgi:hypothetical protein